MDLEVGVAEVDGVAAVGLGGDEDLAARAGLRDAGGRVGVLGAPRQEAWEGLLEPLAGLGQPLG